MRHALLALVLLGCRPGIYDGPTGEPSDHVYDPERILDVEIEMDPADWEDLRTQTRDAWALLAQEECQSEPFGSPFTWFEASVTLDGERLEERVDVRKKAFLGSLSEEKPALKLDLAEYDPEQRWSGVKRLTLNNAVSDPALIRQCVGYGVFRDAGVAASRCGLARVTVNGEELGIYANVEPIKKDLLRRYFDDEDGNLYEGTLSDFREGWTGTFEKKTNEAEDDWSDLEAVVEAAGAPEGELLDALEEVLDLDAFLTFWASEVLVTHWDGYASNTNNFYLYVDPDTGLMHFIPWGIDGAIQRGGDAPASVLANGLLAHRLYRHPEGRDLYLDRLMELLDEAWDEEVLAGRIDAMEAVLLPEVDDPDTLSAHMDVVRDVLDSRREAITAEVEAGPAEWDAPLRESFCIHLLGDITVRFETTWGSIATEDPFGEGRSEFDILWDDEELWTSGGSVAGWGEDGTPVLFNAAWLSDTEAVVAYFVAPGPAFTPGVAPADLDTSMAALFYIDVTVMEDFEMVAYIMGGAHFEAAGTDPGDPVEGTLQGELMRWGW